MNTFGESANKIMTVSVKQFGYRPNILCWTVLFLLITNTLSMPQALSCYKSNMSCVPLSGPGTAPPKCYGASLGFSHTAFLWANGSVSLGEVTSRLMKLEGLSNIPECWAVIQPFLCSVYLPKCDTGLGRVEYPSLELCEKVMERCHAVETFAGVWPEFLRCSKPYFKQNCGMCSIRGQTGAYGQLSYNTVGKCVTPLVRTIKEESWWHGLDGCGVQCENPLFSPQQHRHAVVFVTVVGTIALLCNLFTILTFIIEWQSASRYPAIIIFYINVCFLLATVGWLAQLSDGAKKGIVCRLDNTQRRAEPLLGSGETASCMTVFIIVYYFTVAGMLWFVVLCYAWHVTFRVLGTSRDDLSSKTAYFHLVSWSIPLVLTIVCLAISEIDGDSISGICFVGYNNHSMRAGFVLVPVASVLIVGLFFLIKGLVTLVAIQKDAPDFVGEKAASKITETIIRIGAFCIVVSVLAVTAFASHVHIFMEQSKWNDSLDRYLTKRDRVGERDAERNYGEQHREGGVSAKLLPDSVRDNVAGEWTTLVSRAATMDKAKKMSFGLHGFPSNASLLNVLAPKASHSSSLRPHSDVPGAADVSCRQSDSDIGSVMSQRTSRVALGTGSEIFAKDNHMLAVRKDSVNNCSIVGANWRGRREHCRQRRRRRQLNCGVQPILGPVLSGVGFSSSRLHGLGSDCNSLSSVCSRSQRILTPIDSQSGVKGSDQLFTGKRIGGVVRGSVSDLKARNRSRKLSRLAPHSRHQRQSLSSSRSSVSQLGLGHSASFMGSQSQITQHSLYPPVYCAYDCAQFYAGMGYPSIPYPPFWQPYPYPPPPAVHHSHHFPHPLPSAVEQHLDFSIFGAGTAAPRVSSSSEVGGKPEFDTSVRQHADALNEKQKSELIPLQSVSNQPGEPEAVATCGSCRDDSGEEDLNSSQLGDSAEEIDTMDDEAMDDCSTVGQEAAL